MIKVTRELLPYSIAVLADGLALLLTSLLQPLLAPTVFALFYPAVMISSLYGGLKPGLFAIVLAALGAKYYFLPPLYSLAITDFNVLVRFSILVLVSFMIYGLSTALRAAKHKAEMSLRSLRASEARFSRLAESNLIGVLVADINGSVLDANDAFLRTVGYSREDLHAERVHWGEMTPPKYQEISRRAIEELQAVGVCTPFEKEYVRKDGSRVPVLLGFALLEGTRERVIGFVLDLSERKRTETALQESERRFRRLVESNIFGVTFTNFEGAVHYANDYLLNLLGYGQEELSSQTHKNQALPQKLIPLHAKGLAELKSQGVCTPFEQEFIRKDGRRVPVLIGAALLQEPYDQQQEIVSFCLDLTERKQAEQERAQRLKCEQAARAEAQANEQRYRFLAESIPQIVWTAQPDGQVDYHNQRWFDYSGLTLEQSLGLDWQSVLHPSDLPHCLDQWQQCVATGERYEVEYRFKRATDNAYRWHLGRALPLQSPDGQVVKWFGTSTDIDDQKRAEQTLRFLAKVSALLASSLDYETTLASVAGLALPALADYCLVDVVEENGQICRVATVHTDPDKVDLVHQLRRYPPNPNSLEGVAKVLRTGQSEIVPEVSQQLLEATTQDAEHLKLTEALGIKTYMIVPLLARNRTLGAITFVLTASDRRYSSADLALAEELTRHAAIAVDNARLYALAQRERAEAESANRLKDEFLATLSHELRSPLNGILGWAQLLGRGKLNPEGATRACEIIERNAKAQVQLIDDLLDISRIIRGKMRLEIGNCELVPIIEAALEAIHPAVEAKGICLQSLLAADPKSVMGDPNRLQQILWNLLSNAIKFTPAGGRMQVYLTYTDTHAEVSVSDTGKGISAEFLPHVFERFRQADSSITRTYGGLGLGLAIVRDLVDLHGGMVSVDSLGEGQGSTFTVKLPLNSPSPLLQALEICSLLTDPYATKGDAEVANTSLKGL
ncbi:PAS domain S-box protein [Leptolyngbya sp. FACHB-261]|uniref:PAS domain S-box protein n=1 Tax=Leptolyngbya sp. FACHB-261 TaxID=2692806 RepID=UPI001688F910|nr:PAS domain S-box protein [Leptolyngbya sp. FACHB-261]MBD2104894.1 PAS domain S-box protein [Leptolyngbya sp. FACHB-261]